MNRVMGFIIILGRVVFLDEVGDLLVGERGGMVWGEFGMGLGGKMF